MRICFGIGAAGVIVAGVRAPPLQARGARFAIVIVRFAAVRERGDWPQRQHQD